MAEYLDLADYLLIAEEVLGVPAEAIAGWPGVALAESALSAPSMGFGGVEFYPDLFDKAAVLCVRLARNHPLPDGNKRVAYLALVEFLARNRGGVGATVGRRDGRDDRGGGRRQHHRAGARGLAPSLTPLTARFATRGHEGMVARFVLRQSCRPRTTRTRSSSLESPQAAERPAQGRRARMSSSMVNFIAIIVGRFDAMSLKSC